LTVSSTSATFACAGSVTPCARRDDIVVDPTLTVAQAHAIAVEADHALIHAVPRLTAAIVHTDPHATSDSGDPHAALRHHAAR
jgi:hypothetical protein